jgi:hypothetical protein
MNSVLLATKLGADAICERLLELLGSTFVAKHANTWEGDCYGGG